MNASIHMWYVVQWEKCLDVHFSALDNAGEWVPVTMVDNEKRERSWASQIALGHGGEMCFEWVTEIF